MKTSVKSLGRMFHLCRHLLRDSAIKAALVRMGARGQVLDAQDNLAAGPVALIVDPLLSLNNRNNEMQTAGMTFLGQFLDHDMTFDTSSRLGYPTNPRRTPNARRPFFDLDSLYGDGPSGSPLLYDPLDRAKLRVESGGLYEDLPRDATGRAIIADPRNDENVVIAAAGRDAARPQHDRRRRAPGGTRDRHGGRVHRGAAAADLALPVDRPARVPAEDRGQPLVDRLLAEGPRFYRPRRDDAFIPVEFQMAYRMGHSMVRPSYRANFTGNGGQPFFALVFDPTQEGATDPSDLRGGVRGARRFVGWTTFFRFQGFEGDVRPNKRIDTRLSTPLFDLPIGRSSGAPLTSLAERTPAASDVVHTVRAGDRGRDG
jgi:hypothetical protein